MILGPDKLRAPIGVSDYRKLRRSGLTYVDKTTFVTQVLETTGPAMLVPRPRRFGKTLNLTTLRYFLEERDEELTDIFEDTHVWRAESGRYRAHFQRYPVIYLSFKEVKEDTWPRAWKRIRRHLQSELERLVDRYDLRAHIALSTERDWLERALDPRLPADASEDLTDTLGYLVKWLAQAMKHRAEEPTRELLPVLLIDEYDAPLHTAYTHGYLTEASRFFRTFYSEGLKDNEALYRGVLTGILRMVKADSTSGLNNTDDYNFFKTVSSTDFGLTEPEVEALCARAPRAVDPDQVRAWYNGYRFGTSPVTTIYNPWSVLKYLDAPEDGLQSYWKHSSDNGIARPLLVGRMEELGSQIRALLAGETIEVIVEDNLLFEELHYSPSRVWSLLLFMGYLKAESHAQTDQGRLAQLRIPNKEVRAVFTDVFVMYLKQGKPMTESTIGFAEAMLRGDVEAMQVLLTAVLRDTMSYFDFARSHHDELDPSRPIEAVYQAFMVGLLLNIHDTHRIRSNREAAYGRADFLVIPRTEGDPGAVLELKVVKDYLDTDTDDALQRALRQLRDKDYVSQVRADGAGDVYAYGIVFDGKRAWVEAVR